MKLHANAALSWSGRRLLAERVLVEGWTVTASAEAAGGRCALRREVGLPLPRRGRPGSARSFVGSAPGRQPHSERAGRGDRAAAAAADDGRRDRRDVGDAALDRFGGAQTQRAWWYRKSCLTPPFLVRSRAHAASRQIVDPKQPNERTFLYLARSSGPKRNFPLHMRRRWHRAGARTGRVPHPGDENTDSVSRYVGS